MSSSVHLHPRRSLSPAQELIWTSQRLEPESPHQNMALLTKFDAPIDPDRFIAAVDAVVGRSDALRTTVRDVDGVPHPTIAASAPVGCKLARVAPADLERWMDERISVPLDVSRSCYESVLVDLGEDAWAWFMNVHHIAIDATSSANLFTAVAAEYHGETVELPDYQQTWTELLDSVVPKRLTRARDFWAMHPQGEPTRLYEPSGELTTAAERVSIDMASGRQSALDAFVADPRFALLSVELSQAVALALLTSSYLARMGNETVTIGVPIHHRSTKAAKNVVGPLVELFPLTVEIDGDDTFASLHKRISRSFMSLLSNALPGTAPRQSFDLVLNIHGAMLGDFGAIGASTRWVHPGHVDPHHLLRLQALDYDGSGVLELAIDINHRGATGAQRQRAARHVATVFDAMLGNPDALIHSVPLLDEGEVTLLEPFTAPGPGTPIDWPVSEVLEQRLRMHGERPTIQAPSGTVLSASETNDRISDVARHLARAGYGPGDLIGVEIGVSVDAVIAIHGIQRAGAAFVPIDPSYPEARRAHIRADSQCSLILTDLDQVFEQPVVDADAIVRAAGPDDLAYVIYTSGSTGLPKGVPISYRGLSEYLGFAYSAYIDRDAPTMPLFTSLSFDLTITTLFLPLLAGGLMTIHPEGGLVALREIVDQGQATLIKATPSHLELLVRLLAGTDSLDALSGVIVGGEAFMTNLADRLLDVTTPDLSIFNEYGPTEAVVGCMVHRYEASSDHGPEVPIGRPAPGVALHVLDPYGHPAPLGVVGELYVDRPGMTRGYLRRDDLSREKLAVVPASGSTRVLYRTGDLVRMANADTMIYLGRVDEQIKVGGIRLEPGEIEHVAQSVPGVQRAVARLWSPQPDRVIEHCVRCGLPSDVPDITIDGDGVCTSCHQFELVAPQAEAWFRTEADLSAEIADARQRSSGDYDVIHLISGGKDSTYALYKLVELGARVFAITLDNGFIAEVAKANVRRATEALGVDHEFVTIDGMNDIFRDSLERFSNVCNGCYKAIYTIALAKAEELGVSAIVTGLSRGQFFETRLVPEMFGEDRFDPSAIDEMVREARHVYHTTPDAVSEHMNVDFLADGSIFDRVSFIDFYRYVDVPLSEMYAALDASNTWKRPPDSGRSTNCLINSAGIFVHKIEQGHHNYAAPYSWDVRLGHKTRDEALFELDDPMDDDEVAAITSMLAEVGYEPKRPEMLMLWIEADEDADLAAVRAALKDGLPEHSVPRTIERVDEIPLTANGKVDSSRLPAPAVWRTPTTNGGRSVSTATETDIASVWSSVLNVSGVSANDDFFALGGTSLHALEMIVRLSDHFDLHIPESLAFTKRTIADLAAYVDSELSGRMADQLSTADGSSTVRNALTIPRLAHDEPLPLSAGEEAMLYEWRRDPNDRRYNVARLYRLDSSVDRDRLDEALRTVVAHHETLRTSYGFERSTMRVEAALRIGEATSHVASISMLAQRLNMTPFDIVHGPLLTVHHLTSGHADDVGVHGLLIRSHHIVTDAGSLDVLWKHIDLACRGEELPELEATYAEHAKWQAERIGDPADLWAPATPPAELQLRAEYPGEDGYVHRLAPVSASELRAAPAATLFANALTALSAAVRPYHDGDSLEVAITSSVRDHPAVNDVVGYFLNPLPLLIDVELDANMSTLARTAQDTLAGALEHRAIPFSAVVASAKERGVRPPGARVMLAVEDLAPAHLDGQRVEHTILASGTAVNDLTFFVQIRGDRVEIGCEYSGAVIGRANAEALLDGFAAALEMLTHRPDDIVSALAPVPQPLVGTSLNADLTSVHDLISSTIESNRADIAVESGGASLSYGEVDDRARGIAARLRGLGVEPGDRIAISLPRSVDLIPAIWATWMLGASYVPIDISQPATRLTALIAAADVRAAITSGDGHAGLVEVPTVFVDRPDAAVLPILRPAFADLDDEAYVIFTSGSTGQPKGVSISHRNLCASVHARTQWYVDPVDSYLLVSSAGFDSSIAGIFWTLVDGGRLIIPTEDEVHNGDALLELISQHSVSHALMVPSLYSALLHRGQGEADHLAALRDMHTVIVAGEACPPALVEQHFALASDVALINEYGPTEATVWATAHRCVVEDALSVTVPIGRPIAGMTAEVVDPVGRQLPVDVAGELWLSGPGVSVGYIDSDGGVVDGGVFLSDRYDDRTYRTGDLVVRRRSGHIEFLGRIDDQLSVGGVRIDPLEIEGVFSTFAGVDGCLVTMHERDLVAVIEMTSNATSTDGSLLDERELLARAAALLPGTHIPKHVFVIDGLPRNVNGKLDRDGLDPASIHEMVKGLVGPAHDRTLDDSQPNDPVVEKVMGIFSAAFDGKDVGPDSDFFDLGGDSLRAVAVVSMLESEFGRRVAIGELIDASTPRMLAQEKLAPKQPPAEASRTGVGEMSSRHPQASRVEHDLVEWLRASGDGQPLVVLPPGGGNLMRYAPLVRAIDRQVPVVGIRLPGADARSEILETIEEQAALMLTALDSTQVSGPYRLLGWSTGGLLAWEIARLLQERGDVVEAVVLVDTVMAGLQVDDTGSIKEKYQDMLQNSGVRAVVSEGTGRLYERASFALARRRYRIAREAGETPSLKDAERQLGPVIRRAAAAYSPAPQNLRVIYVSASESGNDVTVDPWRELHQFGRFDVIDIDGVHFLPEFRCILGDRKAPELVQRLREHLDL